MRTGETRAETRPRRHRRRTPAAVDWALGVGLLAVIWGHPLAHADRIERLNHILLTDPSYKVRLQVALTLGKLRDRRAVPALIRGLKDHHPTVRGVCAAALGQLGDPTARPALAQLARTTRTAFVRNKARQALEQLEAAAAPKANARYFVTVGQIANQSAEGGRQLAEALGRSLLEQFSRVDGVATASRASMPSRKLLRARGLKAYVLDGSIVSISHQPRGREVEISCSIRVSLATFPDNSMKAFYTGGATMVVSAGDFSKSTPMDLYKELVGGAAQGARQHILRSYLVHQ